MRSHGGGALALVGAYSYLRARRELATGTYQPIVGIHLAVVGVIVVAALLLAAYLLLEPVETLVNAALDRETGP